MKVLSIQTEVKVHKEITGVIIGISIRPNDHVLYEVVYWDSNGRQDGWFEEFEVEQIGDRQKLSIGFRRNGL